MDFDGLERALTRIGTALRAIKQALFLHQVGIDELEKRVDEIEDKLNQR